MSCRLCVDTSIGSNEHYHNGSNKCNKAILACVKYLVPVGAASWSTAKGSMASARTGEGKLASSGNDA